MDKREFMVAVAAVLTTALETEPSPFPESMAYLALGSDIHKWEVVRDGLLGAGLIAVRGHTITLTEKGRAMARQCNAVLAH